jgi:hypothetical protein
MHGMHVMMMMMMMMTTTMTTTTTRSRGLLGCDAGTVVVGYEGVSKSFRTGCLERELQMV